MHIEAERPLIGRVVDVEAAIAEMHIEPRLQRIIECADDFPIGVGGDAETADIAIALQLHLPFCAYYRCDALSTVAAPYASVHGKLVLKCV